MVINTNVAALTSANNLNTSTNLLNQSLARLSSGSKLVSPADDPAGMAESTILNAQIGETNATNDNVNNAVAYAQTQDGYLQQVGSALDEMSSLAISAQDATKTDTERADYQKEFSTLYSYISNVASTTFNGVSLFSSGSLNVNVNSGDTIQMAGIAANYFAAPVTTTTTTTVPYSGDTTLGEISSAFNASSGDDLRVGNGMGPDNDYSMGPNSTINDMVNSINSANLGVSSSYDSSTGQLSITAQPDAFVLTQEIGSTNGNLLTDLGFNLPNNDLNLPPFDVISESQYQNTTSSPVTITASLTHSVTTTTTTTPSGVPDISTAADAANALTAVTAAITQLATDRATVGANLERLNYTSQSLGTLQTNLAAANSQISDVDVAEESTNYAREQILVQSGTSMLAQANTAAQSVLKLLS
jgi:flagellin